MQIIIAIIGASGSGKTLAQSMFNNMGIPRVKSHTTRPKRNADDKDHVFVTEAEYAMITNKLVEVVYGGYKYCGTKPVFNISTYVLDEDSLLRLKENPEFQVITLWIKAPFDQIITRVDEARIKRDKYVDYSQYADYICPNNRTKSRLRYQLKIIMNEIKSKITNE